MIYGFDFNGAFVVGNKRLLISAERSDQRLAQGRQHHNQGKLHNLSFIESYQTFKVDVHTVLETSADNITEVALYRKTFHHSLKLDTQTLD